MSQNAYITLKKIFVEMFRENARNSSEMGGDRGFCQKWGVLMCSLELDSECAN